MLWLVKLHGHTHEIENNNNKKKQVDITLLTVLTGCSVYGRTAVLKSFFPWLFTPAQAVLWSNKSVSHLPSIGVPGSSAVIF